MLLVLGPHLENHYTLPSPHHWLTVEWKFNSVQSLSRVRLFATLCTAAHQASLSIINSQSLLKLMSIELVMPSNCLIFLHPLLLPPSIFPSTRGFSNESVLHIRWPKYWSFSFSIHPSNEYSGLVGSPCSPRDSQESSPTPQFISINSSALSFLWRRQWHPTPLLCLENPMDGGAW